MHKDNITRMKDMFLRLYLYSGIRCRILNRDDDGIYLLTGISWDATQRILWAYFEETELSYAPVEDCVPILRRLSDVTEKEEMEICDLTGTFDCKSLLKSLEKGDGVYKISVETMPWLFMYLIGKKFDLFGLIEQGIALDEKTVANEEPVVIKVFQKRKKR